MEEKQTPIILNQQLIKQKMLEWREKQISADLIDRVFTEDGLFKISLSWEELLKLEPEALLNTLLRELRPLHELQQAVLDLQFVTGFNDHGPIHIAQVASKTLQMLSDVSSSLTEQKAGIVAACTHDIGNIVSRKGHSILSAQMIPWLFYDFPAESEMAQKVLNSVRHHDEGALDDISSYEQLPAGDLALIIADKTDVSFRRVSAASNTRDALKDMHIVLNLMVDESKASLIKNKFIWKLFFDTKSAHIPDYLGELMKAGKRKWVPDEWQSLYRTMNLEYILPFYGAILSVYIDRIEMTLRAVFALYPAVPEFRFIVVDREREIAISRTFRRASYEKQIEAIRRNLTKNLED